MSDECSCNLCGMIKHTTWISVKDKLPEEGELVLTLDCSECVSVVDSSLTFFWEYRLDYIVVLENNEEPYIWANRLEDEFEKVAYWMPLPKPPIQE